MKIRVYYEDSDAGGMVYHTNYIKYCERARSEILFQNGLTPQSFGGFFVVKRLEAEFKSSAFFGDLLEVKSKIVSMKKTSIILKQEILKDEKLIFELFVTLVYLKDKKIAKIDDKLIEIFSKLERV